MMIDEFAISGLREQLSGKPDTFQERSIHAIYLIPELLDSLESLWRVVKAAKEVVSPDNLYNDDDYCGLCSASFENPKAWTPEKVMGDHDKWCPALKLWTALAALHAEKEK